MKSPVAIIKRIQVTEKSTALGEANKYFFEVSLDANKIEIKKAVEAMYKVKVGNVRTCRYMGKLKRERTQKYGRKPDWKRAVVTLKEGKIELK